MSASDPYSSLAVPAIIGILLAALGRTSPIGAPGVVVLTPTDAEFLRRTGFQTAAAGVWTVTPLPPAWIFGRYPELGPLVGRPAPSAATVPAEASPPLTIYRRVPIAEHWTWRARDFTPDERRLLDSLIAAPPDRVLKRVLQQRLRRINAVRFNAAVARLLALGVVTRVGTGLAVVPEARDPLRAAGIGVRRPIRPRAQTIRTARQGREGRTTGSASSARQRHQSIRQTQQGRRALPPAGTSAWGRSMLARRGGLAVQQRYRTEGRHPTAAATRARLAKQRRGHPTQQRS